MFNKEFSFLEKLYWSFYYIGLISSSEKQNREWLCSDHYGDCCCSTMFSLRCNGCNASWKQRNFSSAIILRPASPGERVERKAHYLSVSTSPFPSSLITYHLNHHLRRRACRCVPRKGAPLVVSWGMPRAAPRCCRPGRAGVMRCPAVPAWSWERKDAFSSGARTHGSAATPELSSHHLTTSFQMEKSAPALALFPLKKGWERATC